MGHFDAFKLKPGEFFVCSVSPMACVAVHLSAREHFWAETREEAIAGLTEIIDGLLRDYYGGEMLKEYYEEGMREPDLLPCTQCGAPADFDGEWCQRCAWA